MLLVDDLQVLGSSVNKGFIILLQQPQFQVSRFPLLVIVDFQDEGRTIMADIELNPVAISISVFNHFHFNSYISIVPKFILFVLLLLRVVG